MATGSKIIGAMCPINYNLPVYMIILLVLQLSFLSVNSDAFTATTSGNSRHSHPRSTVDIVATTRQTLLRHYQSKNLEDAQQPSMSRRHADLITFDLDDTLFPIAPVIKDANEALVESMRRLGYDQVSEDDITDSTKIIRTALKESGDNITYTELRKRAVRREMDRQPQRQNAETSPPIPKTEEDDATAARMYELWELERHASAERHLYPDAIPMLKRLRSDHPSVVIGAVTNGKGNPLEMTGTLSEYFDFCVSGEDADVFPHRKPHAGIYEVAVRKYREIVRDAADDSISFEGGDDGCNWYHVGDDLANDIGASAACGARAIWVDLLDVYGQTASKRVSVDPSRQPRWSTASQEDLEERRIMGDKARASITARIETLSDLPDAILKNLESS